MVCMRCLLPAYCLHSTSPNCAQYILHSSPSRIPSMGHVYVRLVVFRFHLQVFYSVVHSFKFELAVCQCFSIVRVLLVRIELFVDRIHVHCFFVLLWLLGLLAQCLCIIYVRCFKMIKKMYTISNISMKWNTHTVIPILLHTKYKIRVQYSCNEF